MGRIVKVWRKLFAQKMQSDYCWDDGEPILDPSNEMHLYALHQVFLPRIQADVDKFAAMWDAHTIRGPRTVDGKGGGVPNELWQDDIPDYLKRDQENYEQESADYGIEWAVEKAPRKRLKRKKSIAKDPLKGSQIEMRTEALKFVRADDKFKGVDVYMFFVKITEQLLALGRKRPQKRWARTESGDTWVDENEVRRLIYRGWKELAR